MDAELLRDKGIAPIEPVPAVLHGFRLRIAKRATLAPSDGSVVYGMLVELPEDALSTLYTAPSVADYRPEWVEARRLDDNSARRALCYNLPVDKVGGAFNSEYAEKLSSLLNELGFPASYARDVGKLAK